MCINSNVGIKEKQKNGGAKEEGGGVHFIQTSFVKHVCVCGASSPTNALHVLERWLSD